MPKDTNQVNDAARTIAESIREANQVVADTFVAAQERNMQFAQGVFENSVEVLRSHAESSRSLLQEMSGQPDRRQGFMQTLAGSASAAQERNMRLAQSTLQSSNELLQTQVESARALAQVFTAQGARQQEALHALARESMEASMNFFLAPFSILPAGAGDRRGHRHAGSRDRAENQPAWRGLRAEGGRAGEAGDTANQPVTSAVALSAQ